MRKPETLERFSLSSGGALGIRGTLDSGNIRRREKQEGSGEWEEGAGEEFKDRLRRPAFPQASPPGLVSSHSTLESSSSLSTRRHE
jgi:hypothetical protein